MLIKVSVTAKVKKNSIQKIAENKFKISVKEPAQDNRANEAVRELLAQFFNLPESKIRLMRGHHKPSKVFQIDLL